MSKLHSQEQNSYVNQDFSQIFPSEITQYEPYLAKYIETLKEARCTLNFLQWGIAIGLFITIALLESGEWSHSISSFLSTFTSFLLTVGLIFLRFRFFNQQIIPKLKNEAKKWFRFASIFTRIENNIRPEIFQITLKIRDFIDSLLPQLQNFYPQNAEKLKIGISTSSDVTCTNYQQLKAIVLDTFPDMMEEYLNLPTDYAENHIQKNTGRTAKEDIMINLQQMHDALQDALSELRQPATSRINKELEQNITNSEQKVIMEIEQKFSYIQRNKLPLLPSNTQHTILKIMTNLRQVLPKLIKQQGMGNISTYEVKRIAMDYLPNTIEKYLEFPNDFATKQPLYSGETANNLLVEQLELLDNRIYKMMMSTYNEDTDGLVQHGYFLKEKFSGDYFEVFQRKDKENV